MTAPRRWNRSGSRSPAVRRASETADRVFTRGHGDAAAFAGTRSGQPLPAQEFGVSAALADKGRVIFGERCGGCHGGGAVSGGITPDLRASGVVLSETGFADVVRGGSRVPMGMPAYRAITDDQLLALRHFIRQRAEAALSQPKK